ncbi:monoglyceride lipase-like isoform X2 [Rhipicephalus microplus]|uniref:monoglyceride lipase-like isoform X2 n=1 Tax=Rhipicephalus microplus TaxID=6941 RepID=UPI003F6CD3EA
MATNRRSSASPGGPIRNQVGHGMSEGRRAMVKSADVYVDDILKHVDTERARFTNKPVYLVGHSMGGLLVLIAAQRRPHDFAGLVLVAPLLGVDKDLDTWFSRALARVVGFILPGIPVGTLDENLLSRDPEALRRFKDDPLRYHDSVCAGWVAAIIPALDTAVEQADQVELPFLIQHGTADKICDPEASKVFFYKAVSNDKTMKTYPEAYHDLLCEIEDVRKQVVKDIVDWIATRISPKPAPPPPTPPTPFSPVQH